ncbi:hypothetical protein EP7_004320 [Isosphaeraceae bacterium EP7]
MSGKRTSKTVRFDDELWTKVAIFLAIKREDFQEYVVRLVEDDFRARAFDVRREGAKMIVANAPEGVDR